MKHLSWFTWLPAMALLAGCGTLPDAKPFADATGSLAASVRASGSAEIESIDTTGSVVPENAARYTQTSKDFQAAWQSRIATAQACVTYADSIAGLISAGNDGAETVNKVADSLSSLAGAVGISAVTPAFEVAKEFAAFVGKQVAIVRASAQLETAMSQVQPAVDKLATLLAADADGQLKPLLRDMYGNLAGGIKSAYELEDNFHTELQKKRPAALKEVLGDPSKIGRAKELDNAEALVSARLLERDKRLQEAKAAYQARLQLINAMTDATAAWAQAHRDLAAAVRDKREVSVAELESTITELKDLIKKVRNL